MESTFASRVRRYRQDKGLSQQAFAELCGLTQGNIAHMENGTEPKQSNVSKLLAGLPDLSPDWLLNGAEPMLRNGRALTPRPVAEPAADYTSAGSTEQTLYISVLKEQVADLKADKNRLLEQNQDLHSEVKLLLGKPSDSSDAAGPAPAPLDPNDPRFAGGQAPQPMTRKRAGFTPSYVEAAELSE